MNMMPCTLKTVVSIYKVDVVTHAGKIVLPYGNGRIKDWGKKKSMEASGDVSLTNLHTPSKYESENSVQCSLYCSLFQNTFTT